MYECFYANLYPFIMGLPHSFISKRMREQNLINQFIWKLCWDLGRTNSLTRHGDGLGYIKIWAFPPKKLVFWDGSPSPTSDIRAFRI